MRLGPLCAVLALAAQSLVAAGQLHTHKLPSKLYQRDRTVAVYTPEGFNPSRPTPYPVLVCLDGLDYRDELGLPQTLDSLIAAGRLPPLVALLIDTSEQRLEDLANHQKFAGYVTSEIMPWALQTYHVTADPQRSIVAGYSAGGSAAAYLAFKNPGSFGNVLSQSGAFWRGNEGASDPYEWLTQQYAAAPKRNTKFYLEVGAAEVNRVLGAGPVFIEANRRFRDVLQAKGYTLTYIEVPNAKHEPTHWKSQIAPGLLALTAGW